MTTIIMEMALARLAFPPVSLRYSLKMSTGRVRKSPPARMPGVPKSARAVINTISAPAAIEGMTTGMVTVSRRRSLPEPRFSAHSSTERSMEPMAPDT